MRAGDLICAINNQAVQTVDDIHRFLSEWPIGKAVPVSVIRRTELVELSVTPVEAPSQE